MAGSRSKNPLDIVRGDMNLSIKVIISYALDWILLIVVGVVAYVLGNIEPNKRPFSLNDPNISFPFTVNEAVPTSLLVVLIGIVPLVIIIVVCLVFVPGATVPPNTPASLVWKRKIWELHVGVLGLALSLISAFFFTQGMKNLFGKPRPDLLDRCEPDAQNAQDYVVGGFAGENPLGLLYSAAICQNKDAHKLDDGFRSYPSGHSSTAAAGLVYLSLFLASKFAVTIPFTVPGGGANSVTRAAFPSRMPQQSSAGATDPLWDDGSAGSSPINAKGGPGYNAHHNAKLHSVRRQAAAAPIYLLVLVLTPFCLSIFIAASRWWDFRHHGFDILFGYLMGLATSVYSFRYYHLSIQEGAGWAWGPRSSDRAFWAGVGRLGYSSVGEEDLSSAASHVAQGRTTRSNDVELQRPEALGANHMTQRPTNGAHHTDNAYVNHGYREESFDEMELQRIPPNGMDNRI